MGIGTRVVAVRHDRGIDRPGDEGACLAEYHMININIRIAILTTGFPGVDFPRRGLNRGRGRRNLDLGPGAFLSGRRVSPGPHPRNVPRARPLWIDPYLAPR